MMSVWHLLWILPASCTFGFIIAVLLTIENK